MMTSYGHMQQKQYLYVRVVEAKHLTDSCDPYVEVRLGNYTETTRDVKKKSNWNQVFAFSIDMIQATMLEVTVKDKDDTKNDFMGWVLYDLCVVPKRVPPDNPVAPRWYKLEDMKGDKVNGEVMLAVWWGTRADEAFHEAFPETAASGNVSKSAFDTAAYIRSRVYLAPRLWYVRVNVIEGRDLIPSDKTRSPEIFVTATLGNQTMMTGISINKSTSPVWDEDLMFVAAEPFEEHLSLSVEDRIGPDKNEVLGSCTIPLQYVDRRLDHKPIYPRWFNLQRDVIVDGEMMKLARFTTRIHMRICLEGGYHVLDESTHYSSDLRPTAKQLWKNSIGVLEVGILRAHGLTPMKSKDGRATTDAYCVAKYGTKWVRTRTIIDSFMPKWNEQYTWEVFDPCTVITIGVFDNCHLQGGGDNVSGARDLRFGKVRIRLSKLETNRVYVRSYPLFDLRPSGVKRTGEIHLAVRFSCTSFLNMMHMYSQPLLPKMHYVLPLPVTQLDSLRNHATQIVSMRLSRAEPPLRKEIVEYMLDVGSHMWSMRRSKVNMLRIMEVFGNLFAVGKWFDELYNWKNPPIKTVIVPSFILIFYPEFILPFIFLWLFFIGVWNYRYRPTLPPHMDIRLSCAENVHPDALDEEFDTFPTSHPRDIISMRYDRLRSESTRIQNMVGDIATQGERLQSLLSWRDPVATALFVIFCLIAAIVLYVTPLYVVVIQTFVYVLNHLRSRNKFPSAPINFFTRLPDRTDCML